MPRARPRPDFDACGAGRAPCWALHLADRALESALKSEQRVRETFT